MGYPPVLVLGLAENNPHDSVISPTSNPQGVVVIITAILFLLLPSCLSSCLGSGLAVRINWKPKVKINRFNY